MSDVFDVSAKVVFITGGSRGLDRAISLEFARRGAKVVVASRKLGAIRTFGETTGACISIDGGVRP